ncbi:bifunctional metallophosphatase/5'-nucleotidase [Bacillaceae bacterium Marseille-Q3522]|nr:bifunctional metallophosphatase/5'-nucleotidase [Bacillaceae bacterium Marseille-Q3522]
METIHIYHTNDLHSHFENWPRIHQLLTKRVKWHKEAGEQVFLFDIGDHIDLSHPYTEAFKGKGNTRLLNETCYTAVTIGNNEGITLPFSDLNTLYNHAQFDVILANLYTRQNERPNWAQPYHLYTTRTGLTVGVIGLTAYFSLLYQLLGWKLTDPLLELKKQIAAIKEKADVIILLSHLGVHDDEQIAADFPEIDVILGAHTHHIFHEGKLIHDCLLGAAGKFGMYVGHIILTYDPLEKRIKQKKAQLYKTSELPPANKEQEWLEKITLQGKQQLSDYITTVSPHYTCKTILAQLLCDALYEWCDADCALLNEGVILHDLSPGEVTRYDILSICPHPINPCVVRLSGAELKEVVRQSLDGKWNDMQIMGLGFRGKLMGKMVTTAIEKDNARYKIDGNEIINDDFYKLAIPDMFTFGRFFPAIFRAEKKQYYLPEFLREILAWKLKQL